MNKYTLIPGTLDLTFLKSLPAQQQKFVLSKESYQRIDASRQCVQDALTSGDTIYGVNTGFGKFSEK